MKGNFFCLLILLSSLCGTAQKPNIIFVLVDDMGYGDVGVFFQNQRQQSGNRSLPYQITPSLDQMAKAGAVFTQQYTNAPVCAPARASLLTGLNQGNAGVRDNQFDKALENNHTLATVLKEAGYATTAIGKWGLQGDNSQKPDWPAHPLKRGFDDYYGYMRHEDGHEHYPFEGVYRGKKEVYDNYTDVSAQLAGCYTTDLWTARAKKWIVDHEQQNASQPFFMYLAYDAPHAVLEYPAQAYPAGRGVQGGVQWNGTPGNMINTASGTVDSYVYPEYANATYDNDNNPATAEVAWPETFKRYATAVRRLDDAMGDILQLLEDLKIDGNTLVVFSSDNGPSIESYLPAGYAGNSPTFFGSYGPFDGIKRDCWEGGMRMPVLVQWKNHVQPGKTITTPSMLSDWMATFAEAANLAVPARTNGVSLLPCLTGTGSQKNSLVYSEYFEGGNTPTFTEFEPGKRGRKRNQMQMLRMGNYVGVRYNIASADDNFEIYDVVNDPKQAVNLATQPGFDKLQQKLKTAVLQARRTNQSAPRPYDASLIPSVASPSHIENGMDWVFYPGTFPWVAFPEGIVPTSSGVALNPLGDETAAAGLLVYTAYVRIPADGQYTFAMQTDGRAIVKLHEANLLEADFDYTPNTQVSQTVPLQAGYHPITIFYLKNSAGTSQFKFGFIDQAQPGVYNEISFARRTAQVETDNAASILAVNANRNGTTVNVAWTTSFENGVKEFNVYRSTDSTNFTLIGKVTARGNENTIEQYAFADVSVPSTAFYKIEEVNTAGESHFSEIIRATENRATLAVPYFNQNFNASTVLTDFLESTATGATNSNSNNIKDSDKFTLVGKSGTPSTGAAIIDIQDQKIRFVRSNGGSNTVGFYKKDISLPDGSLILVSFDFTMQAAPAGGGNNATTQYASWFQLGKSFSNNLSLEAAGVYAQLGISIVNTTQFAYQFLTQKTGTADKSPKTFSGVTTVKWVVNKTAVAKTYISPVDHFSTVTLGPNSFDLWVTSGTTTTKEFSNKAVFNATPATGLPLDDFKFIFDSGNATQLLDNISVQTLKQDGTATLPVTLTTFTGEAKQNLVRLLWTTSFEQNTAYFKILHSTDAQNFQELGQVKAAGNSSGNVAYHFTHQNPAATTNYYQLEMVDKDGRKQKSKVISVRLQASPLNFSIQSISASGITLQVYAPAAMSAVAIVHTMAGQKIFAKEINLEEGYSRITFKAPIKNMVVVSLVTPDRIVNKKAVN